MTEKEANELLEEVKKICDERDDVRVIPFWNNKFFVVAGVIKNIAGPLIELYRIDTGKRYVAISDEGDHLICD